MKVSMPLSYAGGFKQSAQQAVALEKAGLDTIWVAEAYGFDGVSVPAHLLDRSKRARERLAG